MRMGEPARKHGLPDEDIWHAVRNATRLVGMGDELTMLIRPGRDAMMLEIGVLGFEGGRLSRHPCDAATAEVLPVPRLRR